MRIMLLLFILSITVTVKAQSVLPLSFADYHRQSYFADNNRFADSTQNKKWFFSHYAGLSTSYSFFKGGSATSLAVPLTLQLNRRLNNNLYAFAAVSAVPAYINFNSTFLPANTGKNWQGNSLLNARSLGIYSRAELGLMYVNDAKTFSISGSIGIEKSNYPMMPYNQVNTTRSNPAIYR